MTSQIGTEFRPAVSLDIDYKHIGGSLGKLKEKIKYTPNKEWMLGCAILGFNAPMHRYPLTSAEYRLQAWLLFEEMHKDLAVRILEVMKQSTGKEI